MENNTTTININPFENSIAAFTITISSIGVIANSVLLYLFLTIPRFHRTTYYLMFISCLTDLIANVVNIVSYVILLKRFLNTAFLCKILGFLIYISYGVSIMNLSLIAIYRYLSVVRPFAKVYTTYKKQFIIISEIIIWIVCIMTCLPDLIYFQIQEQSRKICAYDEITPFLSGYLITFVIVYYIIPSAIIIIFYWRIINHQRNYVRPGLSSISRQQDTNRKDKLIKSIMIISACYVLTTWPVFACFLAVAISRKTFSQILSENEVFYWLGTFSFSTVTIISALNPFLHFNLDENIRRSLRNKLCRGYTVLTGRKKTSKKR